MRKDRADPKAEKVVVMFAVVVVTVGTVVGLMLPTHPPGPILGIVDESSALGPVFHPGVILALGANLTTALLGGIGVYVKHPEFSLPVLASVTNAGGTPTVANLTSAVSGEFFEGGVYAIGWNGTDWFVGGQAGWGGGNFGSLVDIYGNAWVNRSALIGPYFDGGGVFALGWNGTSWLLGGNSSAGPSLIAVTGLSVTDLSRSIPVRNQTGWVQLIQWNGAEWMIGGQGLLGTLQGRQFRDLLPDTPFAPSGVYSGGWNGSAWLVGGGAGRVVAVDGSTVRLLPPLLPALDQSALVVEPLDTGWLIGGKGTAAGGAIAPVLLYWNVRSGAVVDLSPQIPSSFGDGEIQGGGWAPEFGPGSLMIVGESSYVASTGYGIGAAALVKLSSG